MINGFRLHDASTAPTAASVDSVQKYWGFVLNLHRVLAQSLAALEAHASLWGIAEKVALTPQERNIAYGQAQACCLTCNRDRPLLRRGGGGGVVSGEGDRR